MNKIQHVREKLNIKSYISNTHSPVKSIYVQMIGKVREKLLIKLHYRSDGPRQGSCGVLEDFSYYREYYYGVSNNCGTYSKFYKSKKYLEPNFS